MKVTISEKPHIHISIEMKQGQVIRSTLSSSRNFTCSINEISEEVVEWLSQYSKGKSTLLNPALFNYDNLTPSMKSFLPNLGALSFGQSATYGELGREMGCHPRGIGQLCKTNPFPLFYPCHRVLAANNLLGGFNFGPDPKITLLNFENINFTLKK